jgi:flagella basal body P-ring formation protein FlgA
MKYSIYFICFAALTVFLIISDCLAERINYLDEVYNKKTDKTDKIILDEKIISIFKDELRKSNLITQSDFEIADIKISPHNISVSEKNHEILCAENLAISNNGHATMMFDLFEDGKKTKSVKLTAKINIFKDVFCSVTPFSNDYVITENDVIPCRVNLEDIKDNPIDELSGIVGKAVKFSIPAGRVITYRLLKTPIIIKRGDNVEIILKTSNIIIRTTGEAMQNGSEGAVIRVKNISTKRDITAKVIDSNTVKVGF